MRNSERNAIYVTVCQQQRRENFSLSTGVDPACGSYQALVTDVRLPELDASWTAWPAS